MSRARARSHKARSMVKVAMPAVIFLRVPLPAPSNSGAAGGERLLESLMTNGTERSCEVGGCICIMCERSGPGRRCGTGLRGMEKSCSPVVGGARFLIEIYEKNEGKIPVFFLFL